MNEWEWRSLEELTPLESANAGGVDLRPGDRVRLKPRAGGDIFDLALAGRAATVEAIEQDYEGRIHFAVIVDDDPGKDLGMLRQPGHRFFFTPDEVEPAPPGGV
jgi:hydrogenase maturation protease